jgi:1-acyl-sn-glycerol-3-phosphate acyltransferase
MMIKYNPEAYIVPITINNSWKVFKYGKFPLGMFNNIKFETHQPIKIDSLSVDELLQKTEATIVSKVK